MDWTTDSISISTNDSAVTLEARVFRWRWPYRGMVWSRPSRLIIRSNENEIDVPVRDVTRRWQFIFLGLAWVFFVTGWRRIPSRRLL